MNVVSAPRNTGTDITETGERERNVPTRCSTEIATAVSRLWNVRWKICTPFFEL